MSKANPVRRVPQDRQMIKYDVRRKLTGRVFMCFLACIIPSALRWVMQLLPFPSFGVVNVLVADLVPYSISLPLTLLSWIATVFVTEPMAVRLSAYFLAFNRDPEHMPSPLSVCDCFGPGYLRLVSGMFQRTVRVMLWAVVPLCIGALVPGTWEWIELSGERVIRLKDLSYLFVLLALAAAIYRSLAYMMVPYLLADAPELSGAEAIRRSAALMRGRLWEMFVLQLSFCGWLLFVSVTLMIAGIYAYPYIEGALAAYYIAYTETTNPLEEKYYAA